MKRIAVFGVVAAWMLSASFAGATTLKRMSLDELTQAAQVVARVRCIANEARWDGDQIYTFTMFEVLETLKGNVPRQITVRLIGGQAGHFRLNVDGVPRFLPGEDTYLFLEPNSAGELSVTSWVQGTFRVRRDAATQKENITQDTGAASIFDPATQQFRPGGVRRMPVDEFRGQVLNAVDREKRGKKP